MDNNAKSRNQIIKDAVQRGLVGGTSGAMAMTIQVRFFFTKNCTFKEVLSYSGINTHVDANDHELSVQIWHFNNSSDEAFVAWRQNPKILPRLWSSTTSRSHFQIRRYSCKCWHFGIVRVQYWIAYSFENRCGFNYSWGLEDLHYANWHSQDHITGNWHFPSIEANCSRYTLSPIELLYLFTFSKEFYSRTTVPSTWRKLDFFTLQSNFPLESAFWVTHFI